MMKPYQTQCIKYLLEFYIDNGKGVVTTLNTAILKYHIQLVQIQCKVMWMSSIKYV